MKEKIIPWEENYMSPVKSIHNQLMSSSNQLKTVCVIKLFRYILKEGMRTKIKIIIERQIDPPMLQIKCIPQCRVEKLKLWLPGQKYIQHHEEKFPSHICHPDQTTTDHTWALHEEPLEHDQSSLCYQGSRLKVIVHHADRIFRIRPGGLY